MGERVTKRIVRPTPGLPRMRHSGAVERYPEARDAVRGLAASDILCRDLTPLIECTEMSSEDNFWSKPPFQVGSSGTDICQLGAGLAQTLKGMLSWVEPVHDGKRAERGLRPQLQSLRIYRRESASVRAQGERRR